MCSPRGDGDATDPRSSALAGSVLQGRCGGNERSGGWTAVNGVWPVAIVWAAVREAVRTGPGALACSGALVGVNATAVRSSAPSPTHLLAIAGAEGPFSLASRNTISPACCVLPTMCRIQALWGNTVAAAARLRRLSGGGAGAFTAGATNHPEERVPGHKTKKTGAAHVTTTFERPDRPGRRLVVGGEELQEPRCCPGLEGGSWGPKGWWWGLS